MQTKFKVGQIVRVDAGRERRQFMVIVEIVGEYLFLANGTNRTVLSPKKKKLIHVYKTNSYCHNLSDESIFDILKRFNE